MNKHEIFEVLRGHFSDREYALISEVSDDASFRSRSLDYMAINLWPSRGLAMHGIELKSHRSDWLNEKKNPAKQESHFHYCDYFWLLTENENVAKLEEIPNNWGWMTIKNGKIKRIKEAPKMNPLECPRSFVTCMLRRAADRTDLVHTSTITDKIKDSYDRGISTSKKDADNWKKKYEDIKADVSVFEKASGVNISRSWESKQKIGEAVNFILSGGEEGVIKKINNSKEALEKILKDITIFTEAVESRITE